MDCRATVKELGIEIKAVSEKQREYAVSLTNDFLITLSNMVSVAFNKRHDLDGDINEAWQTKYEYLTRKWNEKIELIKGMEASEIIDKMKAGKFQGCVPFSITKIEKKADEIFSEKKKEVFARQVANGEIIITKA